MSSGVVVVGRDTRGGGERGSKTLRVACLTISGASPSALANSGRLVNAAIES